MPTTKNHIIYDILEIASSGGLSTYFPISDEQVGEWVDQTRAQLISQKLNKKDDIHDSWVQTINCLELIRVDSSECCEIDTGCYLLRSNLKLPNTLDFWKDNGIISVLTVGGEIISKSNFLKSKYQKYNKYTANKKIWYLKNNYLYVINDTFLELVTVNALFERPSDLSTFISCSGESCFTNDSIYPITINMSSEIVDIVINKKVKAMLSFPSDYSNNANAQTPQQQSQEKQANS